MYVDGYPGTQLATQELKNCGGSMQTVLTELDIRENKKKKTKDS